jgi:DNA repair protein RadC
VKNQYAQVGLNVVRSDLTTMDLRTLFHEWDMFTQAQEAVWVVTFDPMAQLRSVIEVARGNQYEVQVDIAAVMQAAWASGTNRFFLVHNHPSGHVKPTKKDIQLTKQISLAAAIGGMFFEDHIVIGPPQEWWSMVENKQMELGPQIQRLYAANSPVRVYRHRAGGKR